MFFLHGPRLRQRHHKSRMFRTPHPGHALHNAFRNTQSRPGLMSKLFRRKKRLVHFIPELLQYLFCFFFPCRRQRNIVGLRSYRTVKNVTLRHRVERFSLPAASRQKLQPDGSLPWNFFSPAGAASRNPNATARRRKVTAAEILSCNSGHAVPIDRSPVFCFESPQAEVNITLFHSNRSHPKKPLK